MRRVYIPKPSRRRYPLMLRIVDGLCLVLIGVLFFILYALTEGERNARPVIETKFLHRLP